MLKTMKHGVLVNKNMRFDLKNVAQPAGGHISILFLSWF
jgi:hypothetical protein